MTIFSFPPDKGNVGTAAYLDVFGSIHTVLSKLGKEVGGGVRSFLENPHNARSKNSHKSFANMGFEYFFDLTGSSFFFFYFFFPLTIVFLCKGYKGIRHFVDHFIQALVSPACLVHSDDDVPRGIAIVGRKCWFFGPTLNED